MSRGRTRRQLIAGGLGLAAGATTAPAAARAAEKASQTAAAGPARDRVILERLLNTERLLQYAYEQAIGSGKLGHVSQNVAALLLDQEFAHSKALKAGLAALPPARPMAGAGSEPQAAKPPPRQAKVAELFNQVKTETGALAVVVEVENLAESDYYTAIAGLHDPRLITLATTILANEAQHWTLLATVIHHGRPEATVPHPYVRGSQQLRPLKVP